MCVNMPYRVSYSR